MHAHIRGAVLVLALTAAATTGCGAVAPAPTPAPAAAPQVNLPADAAATPTTVSGGLKLIQGIAEQIQAAGTDTTKARSLDEQIEPAWHKIEDTVKAKDPTAYKNLESAFGVLERAAEPGSSALAAKGTQTIKSTVQRYLAAHPD